MEDTLLNMIKVVEKGVAHRINYDGREVDEFTGTSDDLLGEAQPSTSSRIIFLGQIDKYLDTADAVCIQHLKQQWYWPDSLLSKPCYKSNGYLRERVLDAGTDKERTVQYFRCLIKQIFVNRPRDPTLDGLDYQWYELTMTLKPLANGTVSIICFGVPTTFHTHFAAALNSMTSERPDLTAAARMREVLFEQTVKLYDTSVWAISDAVRGVELDRGAHTGFNKMHELLRHALHTTEVLDVAVESLKILFRAQTTTTEATTSGDQFWYRLLQNFMRRSKSNETRLQNEIQLALNLVTQKDSQATISLSKSAQQDSSAVLAITVITLVFLPATFIATLFGMSFFNYQEGSKWSTASDIWIFVVVAAVLTALTVTIAAYYAIYMGLTDEWKKRFAENKEKRKQQSEEKKRQKQKKARPVDD